MGFNGKIGIVREFLKPLKDERKEKAFIRFETEPGYQAQVDWANFGQIVKDDICFKLYCFAIVLGYSRCIYIEFTTSMEIETFIRCHINAFNYFGGYTKTILYDNLKQVVSSRIFPTGEIIWNEKYLDFAGYYGIKPKACWPYRACTKLADIVDNKLDEAVKKNLSLTELLDELFLEELNYKTEESYNTQLRFSGFLFVKTLEQFDYNFQPSIDKNIIKELSTLRFINNAENIILLGPPGVGKTHLSIGLGLKALREKNKVLFVKASFLISNLTKAVYDNRLKERMKIYLNSKLLIIVIKTLMSISNFPTFQILIYTIW